MAKTVLVTGATGQLGSAVAKACETAGLTVRKGVRKPVDPHSVMFDFNDPSGFDEALRGVDAAFVISPPGDTEVVHKLQPLFEAAKALGSIHILFNSAFGMENAPDSALGKVEHALVESGLPYTILRPNFFMDNFTGSSFGESIRKQHAIFIGAGEGKTSFVATEDVAAVTVKAIEEGLTGRAINLTGPEALSYGEIAKLVGEAAGFEVQFHDLTPEQMEQAFFGMGAPSSTVGYMMWLFGLVRAGQLAGVSNDIEDLLGRKPISFREYAQKNVERFKEA
jgi:uncharacterized protein YbjT (DUF2867 family)